MIPAGLAGVDYVAVIRATFPTRHPSRSIVAKDHQTAETGRSGRHADRRRAGAYLVERHADAAITGRSRPIRQGRVAARHGGGGRRCRGAASAELGPELQRGGDRGGAASYPGPVRHSRPLPARQAGEPQAGRYAGRANRECSGCATRWCARSSRTGTPTARWTGCGPRPSAPGCRWPCWPTASCPWSRKSPSGIRDCASSSTISACARRHG